jgi:hypothetical protein
MKQANAIAPTSGRQMSLISGPRKADGTSAAERAKAATTLAQILVQAEGLVVKAPGDDSPDLIPVQVLKRMAVVCVRPSTQTRVMTNRQSQRQHCHLVDIARRHGLADIKFIDDDLGRTASGTLVRLPSPLTGPSDAGDALIA